ncbi:hypothetical protein ACS0TY_026831 [Phlomoides rotata]
MILKGCLGTLDRTLVDVTVPEFDKARYCTRKGMISINVFAACDRRMHFIYMLTEWEGSAADARVLRDVISIPNEFRVPHGLLTPYKMVNYNLHEWGNGPSMPQNYKEYFNMNHAKAINVIEQAFGLLKKWWAIMRSPSFYPIKIQNIIILSCALLHNFIRDEMPNDPLNEDLRSVTLNQSDDEKFINSIQPSQAWSDWRDNLAHDMYNNWRRVA